MIGIYKITNKHNGKSYIGQSIDIKERWENHRCLNGNHDYPLYRAFRKYGIDSFEFEVLEECNAGELAERELYYIQKYDTVDNGYNQTYSTTNPLLDPEIMKKAIIKMTQNHRTKEHRKKQSGITKKLWLDAEYRKKNLESHSKPEARKKMSVASKRLWKLKGKELTAKIKTSLNTAEMREKRSNYQKERFKDEEYREENKKQLNQAREVWKRKMKEDDKFKSDFINKKVIAYRYRSKPILMIDKETGQEIMSFFGLGSAARWIRENTKYKKADYATIRRSALSDSRSAYGYRWKLYESVETIES